MFLLRRLRYQVLQNKKGQGLPASIIAAGLVLILLISFYSLNKMQSNFKLKVDVTNLVQNLRFNIYSAIRNGEASELTRLHADNATPFDCINTGGLSNLCCGWDQITQTYYTGGTTCTKLDGPVTIVNNKGEILSQKRSPLATIASGFDLNGEYCTNFDMVNGNDACPFRFDVTVSSMCKVGKNCTSPQIKYHVKFLYSPDPTNLRLNAAGLLGADKDPNTVSDFDFTILNDAITDASSSEATIKSFDHDYCTGAEVYPSADCNAPDIDTDAVEFWAPPSGVNKFLVEVWGGGGGGAGGEYYETNVKVRKLYNYLGDFYSNNYSELPFSNNALIGLDPNEDVLTRHFFGGGGGAGGGFASAVFELDASLNAPFYRIVIGRGGRGGTNSSDGDYGHVSSVDGPYKCKLGSMSACTVSDTIMRDESNFQKVGDQFIVAFGGKRGKACDDANKCADLNRSSHKEGKGGSVNVDGSNKKNNVDESDKPIWGFNPSDATISLGGAGDTNPSDGYQENGAFKVVNILPGGPGTDMEQVHTSFYHPGDMKLVGTDSQHRVEFDILPNNFVTDGGVAFQLKYKGQIYSQKGVASGFSNTDQFTNDDLVSGSSTEDSVFEAWINDMTNTFNKYIIDKPGWNTEDGDHIKITETMSNNMPGFSGGGFIIQYRKDLGKIPMDLLHVKGELGTDCSADNGGKPCLEFAGNTPNNTLYRMVTGASTQAKITWHKLPDNGSGTFLNNHGGPDVTPGRAYDEGVDSTDDMAGLDGTLILQYNPTTSKWDCLLIDVWNDNRDRNGKTIPLPNTATTPCNGTLVKYTTGAINPISGRWPTHGWAIESEMLGLFKNASNPFEAAANWSDSAGVGISVNYNNDAAYPCPIINVVNTTPGPTAGHWRIPGTGDNQSNLSVNCTVGHPSGKQYVKIRVYQENGGYLSNAQYHKSNNYFTKYYFGGYGGRAPRGGAGGINDFDNLGTPPSVPGGGGAGKMLRGCQSELWYDDNLSGTVESSDFYSYSCSASGDHQYDANNAMRGAPGKVLIYY